MKAPGFFYLTSTNLRGRNRVGGKVFAQGQRINVEGELVTLVEIAKRLGVDIKAMRARYAQLKQQTGPITWERLAEPLGDK